ncbi:MAG TPA: cytochrome o ubiquinol oxidase subunit IV [Candidatus Saccharimonadales bacterium]|nr:cytochrome o ubiquinol oxidase subunit IV [Candidatus Saccharimonadales bacterium]
MDEQKPQLFKKERATYRGSLALYVTGFISSVVCTLVAYMLVWIHVNSGHETFTHPFIITCIVALALVQFFVQLYFFLHLGHETKPRWKLLVLAFMILVVFILVFGSLWIMHNLNYRMTPQQMNTYMINQNGGL